MAINSNLDVLPVQVSTTVNGRTTVVFLGYPHARTTCGVGKTGLQLYQEDPIRNSKLVPIELETGKVLKEINCGGLAVVNAAYVWDYGDGGISILADAINGLGLRLRITEQNASNPQIATVLMLNEDGGYTFPPLFSGSVGYAVLLRGYHTALYLFEVLDNTGAVLKSVTKQITVTTAQQPTPPANNGTDTIAENRTAGTPATPENGTDYNGTTIETTQAPI